jgi:mRNA interferase MazF
MRPGSIVLTPLPQADGRVKNRPVLVLCPMRPFGDLLVCGISTQVQVAVENFDELIGPGDQDFAASGLTAPSLIHLGFVATVAGTAVKGGIGAIDPARHRRLLARLADWPARSAQA